jgi:hypothetical protein
VDDRRQGNAGTKYQRGIRKPAANPISALLTHFSLDFHLIFWGILQLMFSK